VPFFAGRGGREDWHVGGRRGAPLVPAGHGGEGALGCSVDFFFRGVVSGQYMLLRVSPSLLVWWPWWCFFSSLGQLAVAGSSKVEQSSGGYWRCVSAFTLDSEDEGHPLPSASSSFVSAVHLQCWPKWCRHRRRRRSQGWGSVGFLGGG
jgi:hypothetical protein